MNKKEKIQIAISAGLLILLLVIIKGKFQKKEDPPEPHVLPQVFTEVQKIFDGDYQNVAKLENENVEFGRDPFAKPVDPVCEGPELNGILWDEAKPLAVVNKQIVEEGGVVGGYAVISISQQSVVLSDGREDIELYLWY